MTPQGFYQTDWEVACRKEILKRSLIEFATNIRELMPGIGNWKISYLYGENVDKSLYVGRDRAMQWLNDAGMKLRRKAAKPRTTDSNHNDQTYPNLIRTFIAEKPGELIVADITYVELHGEGQKDFCYVSLVMDAYSREIIGWAVGETLGKEHPVKALQMAIDTLKSRKAESEAEVENSESDERKFPLEGLIHHSDRGSQYASNAYVGLLKEEKIKISMTESGNPKENCQAERINGILKNEMLRDRRFDTVEEVRAATERAVETYNKERPHMSLGMLTPAQASKCTGLLPMLWHSSRMEAILANRQKMSLEWQVNPQGDGIYSQTLKPYRVMTVIDNAQQVPSALSWNWSIGAVTLQLTAELRK